MATPCTIENSPGRSCGSQKTPTFRLLVMSAVVRRLTGAFSLGCADCHQEKRGIVDGISFKTLCWILSRILQGCWKSIRAFCHGFSDFHQGQEGIVYGVWWLTNVHSGRSLSLLIVLLSVGWKEILESDLIRKKHSYEHCLQITFAKTFNLYYKLSYLFISPW